MRAFARLEATNMHKATEFRLEAHPLIPEPLERLEVSQVVVRTQLVFLSTTIRKSEWILPTENYKSQRPATSAPNAACALKITLFSQP